MEEEEEREEEECMRLKLRPYNFTYICPLSHPTQPHSLSVKPNKNTKSNCFSCGKREFNADWCVLHFHCTICDVDLHSRCNYLPRKINHPFHPQHPLTFTRGNHERIVDDGNIMDQGGTPSKAVIINSNFSTSDPGKSTWGSIYDNCSWCRKPIPWRSSNKFDRIFYRCLICGFCLDASCARSNPPLTIENPRSHHHPLSFFPRPLLVPCDACGLVDASEPSYACFQCNYMVHESCVDLPRVIKITRHPHRLSHSPYFSTLNSLCRICYKTVDPKYGQYSCKDDGCSYVLHSKCATLEQVWDGKELEWVEEERNVVEDIAPFEKVGDDLIKHFCHQHHLKLDKYDNVRDRTKQCQACVLPIDLHDFYNCTECDFFLHKACAGLPRKADHALHKHSLFLEPSPPFMYDSMKCFQSSSSCNNGFMRCSACFRESTGFRYKCSENTCNTQSGFTIDVRCFLLPDYFTDKCHEHPLFMSPYYRHSRDVICNGCKKKCLEFRLQCTLCEFSICYRCATIPKELHYKYDEHALTLCHGEESTDDKYWCEQCEKQVDPTEWFYTCHKCCITVHLKCVFGSNVYMKAGYKFEYMSSVVKVVINSSNSRPICSNCGDRCQGSIYYITGIKIYCCLYCFEETTRHEQFSMLLESLSE